MQGIITVEDSRTTRAVAQRFIRGFGIAGLAAIAFLGLTDRVNATSVDLDGAHAGDYIDREWYHFLDKGQYRYFEKVQYNLLGGLGYSFGRSYYQIRVEG